MKANATRASVTPTCRNRAPDLASAIATASTAEGVGSLALPAKTAAIHHVAMKSPKDSSRSTSVPRVLVIGAGTELSGGADQIAPPDPGEHAIENAGVGFFRCDWPARNAFTVAVAIGAQGGFVLRAGQRRDRLPLGIR